MIRAQHKGKISLEASNSHMKVVPGSPRPEKPTRRPAKVPPSVDEYIQGILKGNRTLLSKAVTLIESQNPKHQHKASSLLNALLPHTGKALRIGITGYPGAGKSTLIEALGLHCLALGLKPAVLAIDPSSSRNHGSILGDKTRMTELSRSMDSFIRPSPSAGTLGGVARKTRETVLLCEAAGFDVVLIETVGVGQSETAVRDLVDFYLLVLIAGAGDELQGIKRGIMEMADGLILNKDDGQNQQAVSQSQQSLEQSLSVLSPFTPEWKVPVLRCSALSGQGIAELWDCIQSHQQHSKAQHFFQNLRQQQRIKWFDESLKEQILNRFYQRPEVKTHLPQIRQAVAQGQQDVNEALIQLQTMIGEANDLT